MANIIPGKASTNDADLRQFSKITATGGSRADATTKDTVFYSWQSDLPETRRFIEKALNQAIKELQKDNVLAIEPVVDRALKGAAGALRIDHDILDRIAKCAMFVGDVTLVTAMNEEDRRSPNPNVLIELGYALGKLGWSRIILPFNDAFGGKEDLPFDLDKNRLLRFSLPKQNDDATKPRVFSELIADFRNALQAIMTIPVLKDELIRLLDEINPQIRLAIRRGQSRLRLNVSQHRLETLQALLGRSSAKDFVEYVPLGDLMMGVPVGQVTANGIFDRLGASQTGFDFVFKGDPASW